MAAEGLELRIPRGLPENCLKTPARAAWLARLPGVVRELERQWDLTPDAPVDGEDPTCSYVAAVVCGSGTRAMLKIGMPHMEAEDEIQGLRFWDGNPTVRLLRADD